MYTTKEILQNSTEMPFLSISLWSTILLILILALFIYIYDFNLLMRQSFNTLPSPKFTKFKLHLCPCERELVQASAISSKIPYEDTTCGHDAFRRGPEQKVIAFSLYGNVHKKGYLRGVYDNLMDLPIFYPGWIMRLYIDFNPNDQFYLQLCVLACNNSILDLCNVGELPGTPMKNASNVFGMIWRFFPSIDQQVDIFNSRDLDSRFNQREVDAVNEWLSIGEPIHIMRDHPGHRFPFMGGIWGADLRQKESRSYWKMSWERILNDSNTWATRRKFGHDQNVLAKHVWPWAQNMSVQHDSYNCARYSNTLGFPTKRKNEASNFIGSGGHYNFKLWIECPKICRRKGHPDWKYC